VKCSMSGVAIRANSNASDRSHFIWIDIACYREKRTILLCSEQNEAKHRRMRLGRSHFAHLLLAMFALQSHAQPLFPSYDRQAHFKISADPVTSQIHPFTATVGAFGNSFIPYGGAFEPIIFRNRFTALEDSVSRIVIAPKALSHYDSYREGFLDNADVRVYRIERGKLRLVRKDTVAPGGCHISGWIPVLPARQLVSPSSPSYIFRWDDWNRPNANYYFTVRTVDKYGRTSAAGNAVAVYRQGGRSTRSEPANSLVEASLSTSSTESPSLPTPQGIEARMTGDGALVLKWKAVKSADVAGYAVYRSDYPPAQHRGYFLQLRDARVAPDQMIRAGDMIIVSKKFYSASRSRFLSNRVWGAQSEFGQILPGLVHFFPDEEPGKTWELVAHEPGTAVEEPGETYLRLQLSAGAKESLSIYNYAGSRQSWYDVLEKRPYRVEVWLRREKGSGSVRFAVGGFYGEGPQKIEPSQFYPDRTWKKFVTTFTPSMYDTGDQPGQMALEFTGPGTFSVDNFRIYRADSGYLDFLPRQTRAIRSSAMRSLRTHGTVKTGTRTYDMAQLTNPGGVIDGTHKGNTLPQMLAAFRKIGVRPWLQLEYHLAPEEWLGLVEYLAAPYSPGSDTPRSKPWAFKRFTQGHRAPWTDDFDKIYIELSNETWNRLFDPWTFDPMRDAATGRRYSAGEVYGLYQEYVISVMKSSPYWKNAGLDKKVAFVLGGWAADERFSRDAAATSPSSRFLTIAAYNGGWDEAEGPPRLTPASLFYVLNQVNYAAIPEAERLVSVAREIDSSQRRMVCLGTYEAGPGYALNGLNGAKVTEEQSFQQELVMKSLAAGTATLDAFLARASRGFYLQNFFTFGAGPYWKSHAAWYKGGGAYPSWKLLSLFNNHGTGEMMRVDTLSVPTSDLDGFGGRRALRGAPLIATYATRLRDRYSVFVISRKVPDFPFAGVAGYTPVTLDLPFDHADSITLFRLAGQPDSSGLRGDKVEVERLRLPLESLSRRFEINATTGATAAGIPPGATFLYVFEGVRNSAPN
jgi:hypothetical protein